MLIALGILVVGVVMLSRLNGMHPLSVIVILGLLGLAAFIFARVQGAVTGNLQKALA